MVEVFKTDVDTQEAAEHILQMIADRLGLIDANFDLEDCDRIFRIVRCPSDKIPEIMQLFRSQGYYIDFLPDQ